MNIRLRALLAVVVTALCTGGAISPAIATAVSSGDDQVTHSHYRAIKTGMTRAEVNEVTDDATFETDHSGHCTIRYYRGWDREHFYVGVAFAEQHRVADKDSWAKDNGWFLGC